MNFLYYKADNVEYEIVTRIIVYVNSINISLVITEVNCGSVSADDSTCRDYYNIRFSTSTYTLQSELNIDCQVIYSGKILCKRTYYFPINIDSCYFIYPKNKSNIKIVSLSIIINGNVNVKCYPH